LRPSDAPSRDGDIVVVSLAGGRAYKIERPACERAGPLELSDSSLDCGGIPVRRLAALCVPGEPGALSG
jgi:hypothetical protein